MKKKSSPEDQSQEQKQETKPVSKKNSKNTKEKEFEAFSQELQDVEFPEELLEQLSKEIDKIIVDKNGKIPSKKHVQVICTNKLPEQLEVNPEAQEREEKIRQDRVLFKEKLENFFTPKSIVKLLDDYVISQNDAKKALAVAICDHYNRIRLGLEDPEFDKTEFTKHNVLLLGPTGVGKTYLIRRIAKILGVPFVKADATKFSETGYIGYDVEDIIRDLVRNANNDVELAKYGIVYIDEIDKIASHPSNNKDVSGRGVQVNLLKMMEDSEVRLLAQNDMVGQMQMAMQIESGKNPPKTIQTRHILFIVSGAFDRLSDIISQRLGGQVIGFHADSLKPHPVSQSPNLLHEVATEDLVKFGFEPEFVGRLPVRVALDHLTSENLEKILTNTQENLLWQYTNHFIGYGIKLEFTPQAIRAIADQAVKENTGARGLTTILEKTLRSFKYELPGTGCCALKVTEAMVLDPEGELQKFLQDLPTKEKTSVTKSKKNANKAKK